MTQDSRRRALRSLDVRQAEHPGLWFDKFLPAQPVKQKKDTLEPYQKFIEACVARLPGQTTELYENFVKRWRTSMDSMGVKVYEAKVNMSYLAVGLGDANVIENGVRFDHTYGVPLIPGSSLKGLAAHYATANLADEWQKKDDETVGWAHETLFGSVESAGYVTFFDAYPLPNKWKLHLDTVTVHHPDYYQNPKSPEAPADWDDPTPIPFMTVSGTFLVALYGPAAPDWADAGMEILRLALAEDGIGAKTSAGYGRMRLEDDPLAPPPPPPRLEVGRVLAGKVTEARDGFGDIRFVEDNLLGVPEGKQIYGYFEYDFNQEKRFRTAMNKNRTVYFYVEEVTDTDATEVAVRCRPATKAERKARRG